MLVVGKVRLTKMWYEVKVCETYEENDGIRRSYYDKFKSDDYVRARKKYAQLVGRYIPVDYCHVEITITAWSDGKSFTIANWQNKEIENEI